MLLILEVVLRTTARVKPQQRIANILTHLHSLLDFVFKNMWASNELLTLEAYSKTWALLTMLASQTLNSKHKYCPNMSTANRTGTLYAVHYNIFHRVYLLERVTHSTWQLTPGQLVKSTVLVNVRKPVSFHIVLSTKVCFRLVVKHEMSVDLDTDDYQIFMNLLMVRKIRE
jgi:hypothetical protein